MQRKKRLLIIGGGAAGIFCAINAAIMSPELEVAVLERTGKLLSKVKISGGGRCNVTHSSLSIAEMIKKYPRGAGFLKKSFQHFFTTDTINWFQSRRVELKTEEDGRMFPVTDSSQTIINCLLSEAYHHGVEIQFHKQVVDIKKLPQEDTFGFKIELSDGETLFSDYLCIACGGFPKLSQFHWIQDLGHTIVEPVPSLFSFNIPDYSFNKLSGISLPEAAVKIIGSKLSEKGPILITHWGISGPAILKLSAWGARELTLKEYHFSVIINWLPDYNETKLRESWNGLRKEFATQKIKNRNPFSIPQRLWEYLLDLSEINPETKWTELPAKEQNKLIINLCSQQIEIDGKTTFKEEFVTAGGVDLSEIEPNTMESKLIPDLYFAGEIMDVDGITGGFNFQHAWTSGFIAGKHIAEKSLM